MFFLCLRSTQKKYCQLKMFEKTKIFSKILRFFYCYFFFHNFKLFFLFKKMSSLKIRREHIIELEIKAETLQKNVH